MVRSFDELQAEVLSRSERERIDILRVLIASLEAECEIEEEIERAWVEECRRRHEDIRAGRVALVDHEEVSAALRAKFQRRSDEIDRGEVELIEDEEVYDQVRARLRHPAAGDMLEGEVLAHSGDDRAHLPDAVLGSLESEKIPEDLRARLARYEEDVANAWYDEAERRVREYQDRGEVPLPAHEVIAELRSRKRGCSHPEPGKAGSARLSARSWT